ncbi:MAG: hypothetical protein COV74_01205 [Candidatus Omnitrophica bacterium CG11_big_fil_rev_8_21_14_0_20_45_26]|uniref:Uncharacterized protein n=1 Tax=Candidatus Abzuiibacterium crystallinum TaxID=1974748 RepID=A0A2H0LV06_9BACT|nr:MAG: hypothetical protein COV74_01205 [Candidatus Omnitrophica bacterium CG11_big_fil_rev_8_21_14_0_20_45_26]PIW63483.1 MAG: hypothetical protein COW12_10240 [Candidatus Omnitrophica bacterium CG12_big_fil_rev_8_21_14_0_65_45_16]
MSMIGIAAAFIMPFFNIPLIIRLVKRKRSDDISLLWAGGVWVCIVLMTPAALVSPDTAFRLFGYSNVIFFTAVTFLIFYYRWRPGRGASN